MHAGLPCFTQSLQQIFRMGSESGEVPRAMEAAGGTLVASGMALLLKLGFGYVMRDGLVDRAQSRKAMAFFEDNFVIDDPYAPDGKRYYQGKFLIRTRKPGDHMNVHLKFCPRPDDLFIDTPFGRCLNPLEVVETDVLRESEAKRVERDPDKVDLVINFRDVASIIGLIGRPEVDIVGLLLENVVQFKGNVGQLFKLGAIAQNAQITLGLSDTAQH